MFTITKEFYFEASHQLKGLPEDHPCSRLHGHSYKIIVELKSEKLDETGFIKDYRELDLIKSFLDREFDHRHLNDNFPYNPTAENLAFFLYRYIKERFSQTTAVTVKETDKTSATFRI